MLCWTPTCLEGDKNKAASEGRSQNQAGRVATNLGEGWRGISALCDITFKLISTSVCFTTDFLTKLARKGAKNGGFVSFLFSGNTILLVESIILHCLGSLTHHQSVNFKKFLRFCINCLSSRKINSDEQIYCRLCLCLGFHPA